MRTAVTCSKWHGSNRTTIPRAGINDLNIYVYRIINRHPNSLVLDVLLPIRAPCVGYANIDRLVHIYRVNTNQRRSEAPITANI
jgi:hypothetical protein